MNYRRDLVWLITQGASEAELIEFFIRNRDCTEAEAYDVLERNGIEFGTHRHHSTNARQDDISEERRRYLQELSLRED